MCGSPGCGHEQQQDQMKHHDIILSKQAWPDNRGGGGGERAGNTPTLLISKVKGRLAPKQGRLDWYHWPAVNIKHFFSNHV